MNTYQWICGRKENHGLSLMIQLEKVVLWILNQIQTCVPFSLLFSNFGEKSHSQLPCKFFG